MFMPIQTTEVTTYCILINRCVNSMTPANLGALNLETRVTNLRSSFLHSRAQHASFNCQLTNH